MIFIKESLEKITNAVNLQQGDVIRLRYPYLSNSKITIEPDKYHFAVVLGELSYNDFTDVAELTHINDSEVNDERIMNRLDTITLDRFTEELDIDNKNMFVGVWKGSKALKNDNYNYLSISNEYNATPLDITRIGTISKKYVDAHLYNFCHKSSKSKHILILNDGKLFRFDHSTKPTTGYDCNGNIINPSKRTNESISNTSKYLVLMLI